MKTDNCPAIRNKWTEEQMMKELELVPSGEMIMWCPIGQTERLVRANTLNIAVNLAGQQPHQLYRELTNKLLPQCSEYWTWKNKK